MSSCLLATRRHTSRRRSLRSWRQRTGPSSWSISSSSTTARPTAAPTWHEQRCRARCRCTCSVLRRRSLRARTAGLAAAQAISCCSWTPVCGSARCASVRPRTGQRRRDGLERPRRRSRRSATSALLAPARRARLARLLRRSTDDELRCGRLRPLPEGNDLLPRAARRLLVGVRAIPNTRMPNVQLANDDTPILRALAARATDRDLAALRLHLHRRAPRSGAFLRHSFTAGRSSSTATAAGVALLPGSRWPSIPVSAALVVASARRPSVARRRGPSCGVAAAAYGRSAGRSLREIRALAP